MATAKKPVPKKRKIPVSKSKEICNQHKGLLKNIEIPVVKKGAYKVPLSKLHPKELEKQIFETGLPQEILDAHMQSIAEEINTLRTGKPPKATLEIACRMFACLSQGFDVKESAALTGISHVVLCEYWCNIDNEYFDRNFTVMIARGIDVGMVWWTVQGKAAMWYKDFNSTLWMMNMGNRYGWTRKLEGKVIENRFEFTKREIT